VQRNNSDRRKEKEREREGGEREREREFYREKMGGEDA